MSSPTILLASTSRYRRELLARLALPFEVRDPAIDEAPQAGESPQATAMRLALAKAEAVANGAPNAIVIGSDQVADLDGRAVSKPGEHPVAFAQLRRMSGRAVVFHTALAVVDTRRASFRVDNVTTTVTFRELSDAQIESYLASDRPYDCAGSAKIESLGIALVRSLQSDDPTALIGLPLIRLVDMLAECGIGLPWTTPG
jgi:septum formation protein